MRQIKVLSLFAAAFMLLFATAVLAQDVVETADLGNVVEAIAYVDSGDLAGKTVFLDGWYAWTYDHTTGVYEKCFFLGGLGFGYYLNGITYIPTGDYAGNFLISTSSIADKLYIVSPAGVTVVEVTAVDFQWEQHCEDVTTITSGPYQGYFALNGFDANYVPHVFIFSVVNEAGTAKAYLQKDIQTDDLGGFPLGITFLPEDYPGPAYRNHFVISDLNPDPGESELHLRVIDDTGTLVARFPADNGYEGLTYVNTGPDAGKFIVSDLYTMNTAIRNLEGTVSEDIGSEVTRGPGITQPYHVTWLEDSEEFITTDLTTGIFWKISRDAPGVWSLTEQITYTSMPRPRGITALTPDGKHYLLGFIGTEYVPGVGNLRKYEVHRLDADFQLEQTYTLYDEYFGNYYFRIQYIPGATSAEDRLALHQHRAFFEEDVVVSRINYFDMDFSGPPVIVDLEGKVDNLWDFRYDTVNDRYYVLDNFYLIRVFDGSWSEIAQWDVSHLGDNFVALEGITSGDLAGNLALFDTDNSGVTVVNMEPLVSPFIAKDPSGGVHSFSSIQEAVDIAGDGWEVEIGAGTFDEVVVIEDKTNMSISTDVGATVKGFTFLQSDNVTVDGFTVDAAGTSGHGLALPGGISSSDNVVISNCNIHSADPAYSGIKVGRDCANVTIEDNHIHHNGRNGILYEGANGGPHFVNNNLIEYNGRNGVNVPYLHIITLTENTISSNGTNTGSTGGRYGILRGAVTGGGNPYLITLINNIIVNNNGKIVSGKSSLDLGNYHQILDAGDSGNCTTCGCEGAGVSGCQ